MSGRDARRELQLQAALGWSLMYTTGPARETGAAWATALRLAETLEDTDYQLRALWGLWAGQINNGMFRKALKFAERFGTVATEASDPSDALIGERLLGPRSTSSESRHGHAATSNACSSAMSARRTGRTSSAFDPTSESALA